MLITPARASPLPQSTASSTPPAQSDPSSSQWSTEAFVGLVFGILSVLTVVLCTFIGLAWPRMRLRKRGTPKCKPLAGHVPVINVE
jgi:hypothetical protein